MDISYEIPTLEIELNNAELLLGGDAAATDILSSKTAYVKGKLITGSIPIQGAQSYYMNESPLVIPSSGKYFKEPITIEADFKTGYEYFLEDAAGTLTSLNLDAISHSPQLKLRDYLFYNSPVSSIIFPQEIEYSLGAYCFYGTPLKKISLSNSCGTWNTYCFAKTEILDSVDSRNPTTGELLSSCPSIPDFCFYNSSLRTVELGARADTATIGIQAFSNCKNLTNVWLKDFSSISNTAFPMCTKLERIEFAGKLDSLGKTVFGAGTTTQSPSNPTIVFRQITPPVIQATTFGSLTASTNKMEPKIYVPDSAYQDYTTATNWSGVHTKWGLHKLSELGG